MANTYTQINIQAVFSVKGRQNILSREIRPELFKYMSGIILKMGLFPLAVNGWKDHVHLFFEMNNDIPLSKVMNVVKTNSSKWLNINHFKNTKFQWQSGYSGFSYSRSQRDHVINYIMNQEKHHQDKQNTFKKEYLLLLEKFDIKYRPDYLFEFYGE